MEKYYQIQEKKDPNSKGIVIKTIVGNISPGKKLDCLFGEHDLSKYGCLVNEADEMKSVFHNFFVFPITKEKALILKKDYDDFCAVYKRGHTSIYDL